MSVILRFINFMFIIIIIAAAIVIIINHKDKCRTQYFYKYEKEEGNNLPWHDY